MIDTSVRLLPSGVDIESAHSSSFVRFSSTSAAIIVDPPSCTSVQLTATTVESTSAKQSLSSSIEITIAPGPLPFEILTTDNGYLSTYADESQLFSVHHVFPMKYPPCRWVRDHLRCIGFGITSNLYSNANLYNGGLRLQVTI